MVSYARATGDMHENFLRADTAPEGPRTFVNDGVGHECAYL